MEDCPPELHLQFPDHAATFLQIVTGAVGGPAGSFFGALIGRVIPGQIQERLVRYVVALKRQLETLDQRFDHLEQRITSAEVDLFNLGAQAAARSRTAERIEQIAAVVAGGFNSDEVLTADAERLIALLNDVSEDDVSVLCALAPTYHRAENWFLRHPRATRVRQMYAPGFVQKHRTLSDPEPSVQEQEQYLLINFQLTRLETLGLLERQAGRVTADATKPPKPGRFILTRLGQYVLGRLGVWEPADSADR